MLLNAENICTDVEILNVLTIVKTIIEIATIVVPVILTIIVMVDIIKTTASHDVDTKKLFNTISKRLIAAVLIFLVPFLIQLVISLIPSGNYKYIDCYNNAEKEIVEQIAIENVDNSFAKLDELFEDGFYNDIYLAYEQARLDVKLIPNNHEKKDEYEEKLKVYKERLDEMKSNR